MIEMRTCIGCGKEENSEDIAFPPAESAGDLFKEIRTAGWGPPKLIYPHLCAECVEKLKAAYTSRSDAGTLAKVVRSYHRLYIRSLVETLNREYEEAREVFPNQGELGVRTAEHKELQERESFRRLLGQIKKAVAIYEGSHFWIYFIECIDDGEDGFERLRCQMAGPCTIVETRAANALDYAPDGTPLAKQ